MIRHQRHYRLPAEAFFCLGRHYFRFIFGLSDKPLTKNVIFVTICLSVFCARTMYKNLSKTVITWPYPTQPM